VQNPRTAPIRRRRPRLMILGLLMTGAGVATWDPAAGVNLHSPGAMVAAFGLLLFVLGAVRRRIG
jgi:hypothetical protein